MSNRAVSVVLMSFLAATAAAQESTSLNRSEVAAIKAKLVTVQQNMGGDPGGYVRKEQDSFNLPTDFNPAQGGRFWPITSSVQMRFTDRGAVEGAADLEKLQQDFQAKYVAAMTSGDAAAMEKMMAEMTQMQNAAVSAAMTPPVKKEDMQVYVQLNMNPTVGIDPDAVVLEKPGVIALRRKNDVAGDTGQVTVYLDPVALASTAELSKIELRTATDGVTNRAGVYHAVIQVNGALADVEAWVQRFDYAAMMAIFDPR